MKKKLGQTTRRENPSSGFGQTTRRESPSSGFGQTTQREKKTAFETIYGRAGTAGKMKAAMRKPKK